MQRQVNSTMFFTPLRIDIYLTSTFFTSDTGQERKTEIKKLAPAALEASYRRGRQKCEEGAGKVGEKQDFLISLSPFPAFPVLRASTQESSETTDNSNFNPDIKRARLSFKHVMINLLNCLQHKLIWQWYVPQDGVRRTNKNSVLFLTRLEKKIGCVVQVCAACNLTVTMKIVQVINYKSKFEYQRH